MKQGIFMRDEIFYIFKNYYSLLIAILFLLFFHSFIYAVIGYKIYNVYNDNGIPSNATNFIWAGGSASFNGLYSPGVAEDPDFCYETICPGSSWAGWGIFPKGYPSGPYDYFDMSDYVGGSLIFWLKSSITINIELKSIYSGTEYTHSAPTLGTGGVWQEINIPLTSFGPFLTLSKVTGVFMATIDNYTVSQRDFFIDNVRWVVTNGDITSIDILPSSVSASPGEQITFQCKYYNASMEEVVPEVLPTWSVNNDTYAVFSPTNAHSTVVTLLPASGGKQVIVSAQLDTLSDSATITVSNLVTNAFNISIKNISDDQIADKFIWSNLSFTTQGWIIADQYYEVEYLANHTFITGWGLQIYTDNKTNMADPYYKGSGDPSGLIDTVFSNQLLGMAWLIKLSNQKPDDPITRSDQTGFTNRDWHFMLDKKSTGFENEKDYIIPWNQGGIGWHEAVRQNNPLKAYIYIAAKFEDLFITTYQTSQLKLEEYYNNQAKYLSRFFVYTNVWDDEAPVPNHYTPDWEEWSSGTSPTINFGYTGDYYSASSCVRINFGSDSKGAVVWYEPGTAQSCPSGRGYGYDLTGATKLTFWVKGAGNYNDVIAQIGVVDDSCGIIENVDSGGDDKFNVTTSWVKHEIPLAGKDLRYISRGFKIGVWNPGANWIIYVDDIRYE